MDLKELFTRKPTGAAPASDDPVQAARTRARQRLVGAAMLLVAGVIAFPLLFETQPRPLPLNTPITVAPAASGVARAPAAAGGSGGAAVATAPAGSPARPAAEAAASGPAEAAVPVPAPVEAAPPAEPAASGPRTAPAPAAPVTPAAPPTTAPAAPVTPAALPTTSPAASAAASAPRAARYVVQVGAFSEPATAREVRLKVEKLGLKTYTQVVDTESGRRIRVRVGPFASREEAMQTLSRIQAANLPGVVLAL